MEKSFLFHRDGCLFPVLFAPCVFCVFVFFFLSAKFPLFIKHIREVRRTFDGAVGMREPDV